MLPCRNGDVEEVMEEPPGPAVREAVMSCAISRAAGCSGGNLSWQPQNGTLLPQKTKRNTVRKDLRTLSAL